MKDSFLDMRMDQSNPKTAYDVVNNYTERELFNIFKDYGEEKFSKYSKKHCKNNRPINTTKELSDIIISSIPRKFREKFSPCKE